MPRTATPADHALAGRAATEAGHLLVALRAELLDTELHPSLVGDEGDRQAHVLLMDLLAREAPGDAVLSEEGRDDLRRLESERVWIIDPLDGTREFCEPGRTDWAVHVALTIGGEAVAGAVALPARGLTLTTDPPPPARAALRRRDPRSWCRAPARRTRPGSCRRRSGGRLVPMGSAGAKAMAVVLGEADVYAHAGGQYEWDNAAPAAVATAAGSTSAGSTGAPSATTSADPWLPDLLICRPDLAEPVLRALHG